MGTFAILAFLAGPIAGVAIQGPQTVICGEQSVYRLEIPAPAGQYRWHLDWKRSGGEPMLWEGNPNEPVLTLAFIDEPGPHHLWVAGAGGCISNKLDIEALPSNARRLSAKPLVITMAGLPSVPTMNSSQLAGAAIPSSPRAPVPALPSPGGSPPAASDHPTPTAVNPPIILSPNADGVLDVAGAGEPMEDDRVPNPFRVRYHPQPQTRDVPLAIGLVLVGDKPADCSAIINGRLYSPGDTLEGMSIAVIGADTVELRQRNLIVRVPVEDKPAILRLPR